MRERFTAVGLIVITAGLVLIALSALVIWKLDVLKKLQNQSAVGSGYLVQSSLPSTASSTRRDVAEVLLTAFRSDRLYKAESWPVPRREDSRLVLAAPTAAGGAEELRCGFPGNVYCGLYLVTPTGTALLVWGDVLAGFDKVVRFSDANHAVLASAWSFLDYTEMSQIQLDLRTGELVPLMRLELDLTDESAELQVSGTGVYLSLLIKGEREKSSLRPRTVVLKDEDGRTLMSLSSAEATRLAEAAAKDQKAPSIGLPPSLSPDVIELRLFGQPYRLDLRARRLISS